ncbi:MAG: hypothetical protein ABSG15_02730 [FCB group bacterium]|jgi:hypothetical protein
MEKSQETRIIAKFITNEKRKRTRQREVLKTKYKNYNEELGKLLSNFFLNTKISIN